MTLTLQETPGLRARDIAITLPEPQWQAVIQILGAAPFNTVAPLISAIMRQVQQAQPEPPA